jgi:hypothetical protein
VTLSQKQAEFTQDLAILVQEMAKRGLKPVIGEVERTAEQAAIYAQKGVGIVDSLHCKKLAADIHLFTSDGMLLENAKDYEPFGEFWENLRHQNRWGGKFKRVDSVHYERQDI